VFAKYLVAQKSQLADNRRKEKRGKKRGVPQAPSNPLTNAFCGGPNQWCVDTSENMVETNTGHWSKPERKKIGTAPLKKKEKLFSGIRKQHTVRRVIAKRIRKER